EHAGGFEARRVLRRRRYPAVGTGRGVAPRFEHDGLHRGQLYHLADPDPRLRAGRQVVPTGHTVGWLAEHHPVGFRPPATRAARPTRLSMCPRRLPVEPGTYIGTMFLDGFKAMRRDLLRTMSFSTLCHLGPKTFKDLSNTNALGFCMFAATHSTPGHHSSCV